MMIPKYGINAATPEDWNRLRKDHPAVEKSKATPPKATTTTTKTPKDTPLYKSNADTDCLEVIKARMPQEAFKGYLEGVCVEALWSYGSSDKSPEKLSKALVHLSRLLLEVTTDGSV